MPGERWDHELSPMQFRDSLGLLQRLIPHSFELLKRLMVPAPGIACPVLRQRPPVLHTYPTHAADEKLLYA